MGFVGVAHRLPICDRDIGLGFGNRQPLTNGYRSTQLAEIVES